MKRMYAIVLFCLLVSNSYGETLTGKEANGVTWVYEGDVVNGLRHGRGVMTTSAGDKYIGEFRNDQIHGQGAYTFLNGDYCVGEHNYGKADGLGICTRSDGKLRFVSELRN